MSLIQQIQREIDEEVRIGKFIEKFKKRFLKAKRNRKYKFVSTKKEADMVVVFDKLNLDKYYVILNREDDQGLIHAETNPQYTLLYLKNTNTRDTKLNTMGELRVM